MVWLATEDDFVERGGVQAVVCDIEYKSMSI